MSLSNEALTDLSTVKNELGISTTSDDSLIERYIEEASDRFVQETGRNFHWATNHVEKVSGYQGKRLIVQEHLPIDTINQIDLDLGDSDETVDSGTYEIEDADLGFIWRTQDGWARTESFVKGIEPQPVGEELKLYKVDYDGGYETPNQSNTNGPDLPRDIESAIIDLVVKKYRSQGRDPSIRRERVLSAGVSYKDGGSGSEKFDQVVKKYQSTPIA